MERYNNALCKEIEQFGKLLLRKRSIETIFLGGGTPSTWPDHLLLDMFAKLRNVFTFAATHEITIEINPGTIRVEQLELWKQVGINRLSIGVQTLDDKVLHRLNRHQTNNDVYFLIEHAPSIFDNISIDLIIGLPGVEKAAWKGLLKEVVSWPITHISLYCLTVHKQTKLYFETQIGSIKIPDDDYVADLYAWSVARLEQHGFNQYEVSNFARTGYESRHNMMYWQRKPYKGFGLGACSFDGTSRLQNQKNIMGYMYALEEEQSVTQFEEQLTSEQVQLEIIMLGLRTIKGVNYAQLMEGISEKERLRRVYYIEWLKQHNFMYDYDGCLRLTPKGMAVEHEIVATFFSGVE